VRREFDVEVSNPNQITQLASDTARTVPQVWLHGPLIHDEIKLCDMEPTTPVPSFSFLPQHKWPLQVFPDLVAHTGRDFSTTMVPPKSVEALYKGPFSWGVGDAPCLPPPTAFHGDTLTFPLAEPQGEGSRMNAPTLQHNPG
jgi:hypothetical protein